MAAPDPDGWTLAEALDWLDPKPTVKQLELLVRANGIRPIGTRRPRPGSRGGRPAPVYRIEDLIDVHADNVRWIVRGELDPAPGPSLRRASHPGAGPVATLPRMIRSWASRRIVRWLATPVLGLSIALFGANFALANGPLCESFDIQACAGTVDFSIGAAVGQAHVGRSMMWNAGNQELVFTGASNRCLRMTDDGFAVVGQCAGVNGILWHRDGAAGDPHHYINNRTGLYLNGDGTFGDQIRGTTSGAPGDKQWDGP